MSYNKLIPILATAVLLALLPLTSEALAKGGCGSCTVSKAPAESKTPQTLCPIMGGEINKEVFTDVAGYRVYACCKPCLAKIEADPKAALQKIRANGEQPGTHLAICSKCGEIKGLKQCCDPASKICAKCQLNEDSPGCRLHNAKSTLATVDEASKCPKSELATCTKRGEPRSSDECCHPKTRRCSHSGQAKTSPGCGKDAPINLGKDHPVICGKSGAPKGNNTSCCKDKEKKCGKYEQDKGNAACCGIAETAEHTSKETLLCHKCGEVKGDGKCCNPNAAKCSRCGLNNGSPACCKLVDLL